MKKFLIFLLVMIVLLTVLRVGWLLPHRYIATGVDNYSGIEREYANTAIEEAKFQMNEWGSPGPLVAAYRVTCVKRCPDIPLRCGPPIRVKKGVYRENPACEGSPFAVDVRTYTFFGLPLGNVPLACDS